MKNKKKMQLKEIFKELDTVYIKNSVSGYTKKNRAKITIPAKSEGDIVYIGGNEENPHAYTIEFYIRELNDWAYADVAPELVVLKLRWRPEDS